MKILVTGAKGFVGKNLIAQLKNEGYLEIFEYDKSTEKSLLENYVEKCDFVFHLAGVNRPENEKEFMEGNFGFTSELLALLKKYNNKAPILITSSVQAKLDNPYGKSKKAGEDLLFNYGIENDIEVFVYRLHNLFGKWSKPNYNTVVATFCNNIARNIDIKVNDNNINLVLCYIDDVVNCFIQAIQGRVIKEEKFCIVPITYNIKLGDLANKIREFKESRKDLSIVNMEDELTKKLYSTYLSFLQEDDFAYDLKMNEDNRGSFTEMIRTPERGQVSVNVSKPGITKGNHWHNTKNEKFLVVSGEGLIRFRKVNESKILEYKVNGDKLQIVDIPTGYTHSIVNVGESDLVTVMWVNECFEPENPDTYYLEV